MPVRRFHVPVLVRVARIVPARRQPVMRQELLVRPVERPPAGLAQLVRRRRQIIGPVLPRHPAQLPQALLQSADQRLERFRARDRHALPVRVRQHETVYQVLVPLAPDRHPQRAHVGEVRLALRPRLPLLLEIDFPVRTLPHAPGPESPLQRPQLPGLQLPRMAPLQLLEHHLRLQPRVRSQQGLRL